MKKFLLHQKGVFAPQQKHEMNLNSHFLAVLFLLLAFLSPWTAKAQTTVTIGTGTTQNPGLPLMMEWNYSMTQQIYKATEIGQAGLIQSIAFDYVYTQPFSMPGVKVYMKNVSKNTFDNRFDMVAVSESDKVFEGTFAANGAGWVTLTLDIPFYYDGTSNLLICFYDCTSGHLSSSYKFNCTISTKGSLNYYIDSSSLWYFDIQELKANYNANAALGNYRNNIKLNFNNNSIITFADPNVKQICVQYWDTNNDGELSYAEAAAVTSLIPTGEDRSPFYYNDNVTSFDELQYFTGLTTIELVAFAYCRNLASVIIPSSVTSLSRMAFCGTALTSLDIPNSVNTIGSDAVSECHNLQTVTLPNTLTTIGSMAFDYCTSLTSIEIPASVTTIGYYNPFSRCPSLASIMVDENNTVYSSPNNCNAIIKTGTHTLISGCMNTIIPDDVTTIGEVAFWGSGLVSVIIPNNVTTIGERAFYDCHSLTSVVLPNNLTVISSETFRGCTALPSIEIPNSVTSIDTWAFFECNSFTSFVIPATVTSLGYNPFGLCASLVSITVDGNNPVYSSPNNCNAIIETTTHTLVTACINTVIPDDVTTIGVYAIMVSNLTSIEIPNSVTSILGFSFWETPLTSIEIPNSVTSIGEYAFYYCTDLASITMRSIMPPVLGDGAFAQVPTDNPVYVPCGSMEAYQTYDNGDPWGGFTNFQCLYDAYPYVENFETSCDWQLINGDLTNKWVWGEASTRSNHYLYISNNDGVSCNYSITSPAMVYATKLFHFEEGWYRFQYDWLAYGESTYDYLRVALVPASVELSASTSVPSGFSSQALPTGWIALDGGARLNQNSWWQTTYSEINVPSGDYLMVFAWRNDNSVGTQPPASIDNVSIRHITCFAPTQLIAQHVGATQVTLDWTPAGDEDGWEVWLSWTSGEETCYVPYTATTHPFTLTGLSAGRTYTVSVYAVCGPDNASLSSNEISFTTSTNLCDNPITLPFTENFDGYTGTTSGSVNVLPSCWSRINTTTASNFTGYPSIFEYSSYAHSSNNFLYFMSNYNNGDDPQDQYVILPNMESVNGLALSLYARAVTSNRVAYFEVGVMTNPADASTFTEVASFTPTSTTYEQYTVTFGSYMGTGTYIAIRLPAASSDVIYRGLCIDDVIVTETSSTFCNSEDQCQLTFTLIDSYGDTWNGNAIKVVDEDTDLALAIMTNDYNNYQATGQSGAYTQTKTLTVCDGRELRFEWIKGSWATECSYTIADANGTVILQGTGNSSMNTGDVLGTYTVSCTPIPIFLTDGNWNDSNCWSMGAVPAPGSDVEIRANVTIPAGYTAIADFVDLYSVGSITIEDGGQLRHNTSNLRVTMKKNIVPYTEVNGTSNYHLLAFPFSEQVAVPAAMTATEGYDFYKFDPNEPFAEWRNNRQQAVATVGGTTGYLYANPEPIVLSLTGKTYPSFEEESRIVTVPYTEGSSNLFNGWALLGNPFTCEAYVYSFDYELFEYVPMKVMVYNANGRLVTLNGGPLRPMQGFFVKVTQTTTVYIENEAISNYHYYVDLGLPSGTLWATCNVGADTPEGYGDYFAWGETTPKDRYSLSTYQYCGGADNTMTKYCNNPNHGLHGFTDNLTTLQPEDDAATANWGDGWRMPTQAEWQELLDNTTMTWTTQNGVNGRLFTASNGNSLFLPAAGDRWNSGLSGAGSDGFYFSSSLYTDNANYAWGFYYFDSGEYYLDFYTRVGGASVRPVRSGVVP